MLPPMEMFLLNITAMKVYQDQLAQWGIKDDRIRRPLARPTILSRLVVRFTWSLCLFSISLPGLMLWLPVFATTFYAVRNFKKTGPIFDTWDEIAQYKLIYGLISGLCVWMVGVALTWPFALVTAFLIPAFMWITLRWFEDAVAAFRAFTALFRLLCVGNSNLKMMFDVRRDLHSRVMNLAIAKLDLPANPESHFSQVGGKEKGRVRGSWESGARYFSIRRRRKRDWNETLRLYDKVDYPEE
jgi:glycerol-3-phosphate O-acyltransferase / dihydroxyacetone phosphate acyltransferase